MRGLGTEFAGFVYMGFNRFISRRNKRQSDGRFLVSVYVPRRPGAVSSSSTDIVPS